MRRGMILTESGFVPATNVGGVPATSVDGASSPTNGARSLLPQKGRVWQGEQKMSFEAWRTSIQDPFEPEHDLGRVISRGGQRRLEQEFRRGHKLVGSLFGKCATVPTEGVAADGWTVSVDVNADARRSVLTELLTRCGADGNAAPKGKERKAKGRGGGGRKKPRGGARTQGGGRGGGQGRGRGQRGEGRSRGRGRGRSPGVRPAEAFGGHKV
jgi:hypothetical protein